MPLILQKRNGQGNFSRVWAQAQAGFSQGRAWREWLCKDPSKPREIGCFFPLKLGICACSILCRSQDIRGRKFYSVNQMAGQSTFHTESFFNILFPNQAFLYNLLKGNSPKRVEWVACLCWTPSSVLAHTKVCHENSTDITRVYCNSQHKKNWQNLSVQDIITGYGNCQWLPWVQNQPVNNFSTSVPFS